MTVTYIERVYLDRFSCIDRVKTFRALSYFIQGGLYYFKVDRFNYKVVEKDRIIDFY